LFVYYVGSYICEVSIRLGLGVRFIIECCIEICHCGLYPSPIGFICGLSYPKGVHYLSISIQLVMGSYQLGISEKHGNVEDLEVLNMGSWTRKDHGHMKESSMKEI